MVIDNNLIIDFLIIFLMKFDVFLLKTIILDHNSYEFHSIPFDIYIFEMSSLRAFKRYPY